MSEETEQNQATQKDNPKHPPKKHREQTPSKEPTITKIADLQRMNIDQLAIYAKNIGLENLGSLTKSQMVFEVVKLKSTMPDEVLVGEGVLEVLPDGFGFLRSPNYNYLPSAEDIYVSPAQIRRFDLKKGDTIYGTLRSPKEKERNYGTKLPT